MTPIAPHWVDASAWAVGGREPKVTVFGVETTRKRALLVAATLAAWAGSEGTAQQRWDAVLAMGKIREVAP